MKNCKAFFFIFFYLAFNSSVYCQFNVKKDSLILDTKVLQINGEDKIQLRNDGSLNIDFYEKSQLRGSISYEESPEKKIIIETQRLKNIAIELVPGPFDFTSYESHFVKVRPEEVNFSNNFKMTRGILETPSGVKFGGNVSGAIRWNGSDFEGYTGSSWVSLTGSSTPSDGIWVSTSSDSSCLSACPPGYYSGSNENGHTCKDVIGRPFTGFTFDRFNMGSFGLTFYFKEQWGCGSQSIENDQNKRLGQCFCIKY